MRLTVKKKKTKWMKQSFLIQPMSMKSWNQIERILAIVGFFFYSLPLTGIDLFDLQEVFDILFKEKEHENRRTSESDIMDVGSPKRRC